LEKKIPVRWSAPELLQEENGMKKCSEFSDVWSYGVTIWEIFEYGKKPYADLNNDQVRKFVLGGGRLSRPVGCPDKIWEIATACWKWENNNNSNNDNNNNNNDIKKKTSDRPTFREISQWLEKILKNYE
jgi:serine/threonine protein kinase